MIYRLEVENFFSIREAQVLDLRVGANVPDPDGRFAPIFPGSDERAPKVVSVYGANASGKTTILRALQFIANLVGHSGTPTGQRPVGYPFNDDECAERPTKIAVELGGILNPSDLEKDEAKAEFGQLRYEVELFLKDGVVKRIVRENLTHRAQGTGKWSRVVNRTEGYGVKGSDEFNTGRFRHLLETLRDDASVISSYAFFNHPTAEYYASLGRQVLTNIGVIPAFLSGDHNLMAYLKQQPAILKMLNRDLRRIDVGVEELRIEDVPNLGPQARVRHTGHSRELPWEMESQGTQAFVRLFPILHLSMAYGALALVDEFDTLIHPLVLPEILRWFYDDQVRNADGAQIWMSCHSATLLEYLVKEEVVFAEKDTSGRTSVYSLTDVSSMDDKAPVRRTANLYKKYLSGAFGAVPVIG
ncbi:AAA family ATPase [Asticcacaulis sp. W401b]|uniref:AAA family ATPase n=1 Tax=Asticcacaulis sp. W401b TaxID=3388666 RepID=UPI003970664F